MRLGNNKVLNFLLNGELADTWPIDGIHFLIDEAFETNNINALMILCQSQYALNVFRYYNSGYRSNLMNSILDKLAEIKSPHLGEFLKHFASQPYSPYALVFVSNRKNFKRLTDFAGYNLILQ